MKKDWGRVPPMTHVTALLSFHLCSWYDEKTKLYQTKKRHTQLSKKGTYFFHCDVSVTIQVASWQGVHSVGRQCPAQHSCEVHGQLNAEATCNILRHSAEAASHSLLNGLIERRTHKGGGPHLELTTGQRENGIRQCPGGVSQLNIDFQPHAA